MKVAEYYRYADILPRHWERLAKDCGFPADEAVHQVGQLVANLPSAAAETAAALRAQGADHAVLDALIERVDWRCAYLQKSWDLVLEPTAAPDDEAPTVSFEGPE